MKYPGCDFMETAYADEEVVIRKSWQTVYVYHKITHKTPFGNYKSGWLCSGTWAITADGKFREQDGVGYLGRTATTIEEIVKITKERRWLRCL